MKRTKSKKARRVKQSQESEEDTENKSNDMSEKNVLDVGVDESTVTEGEIQNEEMLTSLQHEASEMHAQQEVTETDEGDTEIAASSVDVVVESLQNEKAKTKDDLIPLETAAAESIAQTNPNVTGKKRIERVQKHLPDDNEVHKYSVSSYTINESIGEASQPRTITISSTSFHIPDMPADCPSRVSGEMQSRISRFGNDENVPPISSRTVKGARARPSRSISEDKREEMNARIGQWEQRAAAERMPKVSEKQIIKDVEFQVQSLHYTSVLIAKVRNQRFGEWVTAEMDYAKAILDNPQLSRRAHKNSLR